MAETFFEESLTRFGSLTKKPEKFISNPSSLIGNIKNSLKENYDFTKSQEEKNVFGSLKELVVKDFEVEQIWQQIELQNDKFLDFSLHRISKLLASKDTTLWFNVKEENQNSDEGNSSENSDEEGNEAQSDDSDQEDEKIEEFQNSKASDESYKEEEEENPFSDEENEKSDKLKNKKKFRKSVVDDQFFNLDEMTKFLTNEEREKPKKKSEDSDEESIDFFEADDSEEDDSEEDEEPKNPKYKDFFSDEEEGSDKQENQKNSDSEIDLSDLENQGFEADEKIENSEEIKKKKLLQGSDSEDDPDGENSQEKKSSLEIREERLKKKIEEIEQKAVQDKGWQLKGEITAADRPQNSLLEEVVEFDLTSRPAPVITQETTFKLEDLIKQRIKDKAFDDVIRKIKPTEAPTEYKKKLILDQEKSKQSLAQIYEDEYLKAKEALDPNADEKEEVEPKEHTEIKGMMKSLFAKLDALSNFHFTPKTVAPELKVINNLPAISMEEVAPVAVSDAALLAPEEIKEKQRGDLVGKTERTDTDKKRERRQKKAKQKKHAVEKQKKEETLLQKGGRFSKKKAEGLLNKVTKDRNVSKMNENSQAVKSSSAFFTQLEEEVKGQIKSTFKRKQKIEKPQILAKKIKL